MSVHIARRSLSISFPFPLHRTIVSYTLTTSLFIVVFLCSVFLFTKRTLEPSLAPYLADISLSAADSIHLPQNEPTPSKYLKEPTRDSGDDVTVETNPKEEAGDPRFDDQSKKVVEDSTSVTKTDVEAEEEGGGGSRGDEESKKVMEDSRSVTKTDVEEEGGERGEVSVEVKEESNVDSAAFEKMRGCDLYKGSWVKDDDEYPLYQPGSCPYVDEAFDCQRNGKRDSDYLKWKWKPDDCDLPRYDTFSDLIYSPIFEPPLLLHLRLELKSESVI